MSASPRPRLAWFSPLRPIASGISWYSEEILPLLARAYQIDIFVDRYVPSQLHASPGLHIRDAREFERRDRSHRYDGVIYQMGNSPAHSYMYERAIERPGLLVLHDTLLHHLQLARLVARGRGRSYRELMVRRYGQAGQRAAELALRGQLTERLFDFSLSEDLIEASLVVAAHSEFSLKEVRRIRPEVPAVRIPMGIRLPREIDRSAARQRLGLPDDVFVIGSVTQINPYKRLDVVLRAARRLQERLPVRVLIAGGISPAYPLARIVSLMGLDQSVEILGFVDDVTARLVVAASDVCVNLRYPTAGETSASLLRTMGAGRAVLVSDAGSFSELPDDAVVKVPVDALEDETVLALLEVLACDPALRSAIGDRARDVVAQQHSLAAMAGGYSRALELLLNAPVPTLDIDQVYEELRLPPYRPEEPDPLVATVGRSLAELGLAGEAGPIRSAARALVELGIGPGKIDAGATCCERPREGSSVKEHTQQPISQQLLEILACPLCKTPVRLQDQKLVCTNCGRRYWIEDGIPIMLLDEAELPSAG